MNQKIGLLIDQYNNLMDSLIEQIRELKLRKNIQFTMLWLRQLAKDQEEYELMRQIYRMDFKDLTCALVHSIYFKIVHNQVLERKSVKEIDCYKGIAQILEHLSQERQTRSFLSKKIAQIEGILQNGEILKRALPDKLVFKENIKEVLLQSPEMDLVDIKYNKCKLLKNSRQYISIFSKYPIVHNAVYHINFTTKYTNVMLGVCTQNLIKQSKGDRRYMQNSMQEQSNMSNESSLVTDFDKHYSKESIVFNCTNGCVYKDGMFESGSSALTKGQKELVLKMRITSTNELIVLLGKNVLCRQKLDNLSLRNQDDEESTKFYLHILLRTQGDSFDVDRDKDLSGDGLPHKSDLNTQNHSNDPNRQFLPINPRENINFDEIKRRNQQQVINVNNLKEQIVSAAKAKEMQAIPFKPSQSSFSYDFNNLNSSKLLGQLNAESAASIKYSKLQQKARQEAVKRQVKKLEQKRKQQQIKPAPSYKKLSEIQKEKQINQIIKRQRIDQILNDLKSKPVYSAQSKGQPGNNMVAKKLKEIQQRKAAIKPPNQFVPGNRENAESSKYKKSSYNEQNDYNQRNLIALKPVTVQNRFNQMDESSYQASSENNDLPIFKSSDIQPLLFQQKNTNLSPVLQIFNQFPRQSHSLTNNKNQYTYHFEEPQEKGLTKLRPSQKIFNLEQEDESSQFDRTHFKDQSLDYNGTTTPIDGMRDFQFAKRSARLNPSSLPYDKNTFLMKKQPSKSLFPAMNEHEQSHVMEAYDIGSPDRMDSRRMSINNGLRQPGPLLMPQLKQSHFSKMTSQQSFSHMQESFGRNQNRRMTTQQSNLKKEGFLQIGNEQDRRSQDQSAVNIDMKSDSFQIGSIIGPLEKNMPKDNDESYIDIDHSFDMTSNRGSNRDQSIIDIRFKGTQLGI